MGSEPSPSQPPSTADVDTGWHVVVLKAAGFTAFRSAMTRQGSFPSGDYGTHCVCCNAETKTRLLFNPSAGHAASPIAIPRCPDCATHVASSNPIALFLLGAAAILLFALSWKNGVIFAVLGGLAVVGAGAFAWSKHAHRMKMRKEGHFIGLEVVAIPGLVSVRTTNPTFAREVRERNADLLKRD